MSLAKSLVNFYAHSLPYHRGKWRAVEALIKLGRIEAEDAGKTYVVSRGGVRWKLNTACSVQRRLYYHGGFDLHDFRELVARLPERPVFFDIGAYFGYYGLKIRNLKGPGSEVHEFEPVPANFALLEEHRRLNGFDDVKTHQVALSDRVGEVSFEIPPDGNGGVGRITGGASLDASHIKVRCLTLDAFVEENGVQQLHGIKLDVEGAELSVVHGGAATLKRFKPVILMELNPPCLKRFGVGQEELLAALKELGYSFHRATPGGLEPFSGLRAGESYTNILCLAK